MSLATTHYGCSQDLGRLSKKAERAAISLIKLFKKKAFKDKHPMLLYSGMSGTSFATMLSYFLTKKKFPHGMAYVRKRHEKSHGKLVELAYQENYNYQAVFVDDFISVGNTITFVINRYSKNVNMPIRFLIPDTTNIITVLHEDSKIVSHWDLFTASWSFIKRLQRLDN